MGDNTLPVVESTGTPREASLIENVPDDNPLKPVVAGLLGRIDQLEGRVDALSAGNENTNDEIAEIEDDTEKIQHSTEYAHERIDRLEYDSDGPDPSPPSNGSSESPTDGPTPLEQITNIPEHLAADELTENQQRARFVASDITDYATSSPKGYTISSSTIAKVLTVRDDGTPHTQTVSRVMDFLTELGKEDVYLTRHKGKKLAVFENKPAAERYGKGQLLSLSRGDVISERTAG